MILSSSWRRPPRRIASIVTVALVLAACGGGEAGTTTSLSSSTSTIPATTAPTTEAPTNTTPPLEGTVVMNTSGGSLNDAFREVWWNPFTADTGVDVVDTSPVDLALLQQQVSTGNVEMDLIGLETGGEYLRAANEGLLAELDHDKLRSYFEAAGGDWDDLPPESIGEYGTWFGPFATIIMFDKRAFPDGGEQPTSAADIWDTEKFPGKRCLANYAQFTLEIALAADGVAADDMYPLDVDRALTKLEEVRPDLATLWSAGAEPVQLLADGECVITTVWNGRPYAAATQDGLDYLGVAWDGAIFHRSWLVIPKDAPNPEGAYALLARWLTPEVGAAVAELIVYTNPNIKTADMAPEVVRPYAATAPENLAVMTIQDDGWWTDNGAAAEEAFAQWATGG